MSDTELARLYLYPEEPELDEAFPYDHEYEHQQLELLRGFNAE